MLKSQKAFTLIEMLFVLLIISILLILIVPSFSSKSKGIQEQGCEALVQVVQSQVETYRLNENTLPTSIQDLVDEDYISTDQSSCPNGKDLTIDGNGTVVANSSGD